MIKNLGIIGCQSKHAEYFGSLFNKQQVFPGYQVAYIYGDDAPERLSYVINTANIPTVCHYIDELIEKSDAVIMTYRLAQRHLGPALGCIRKRKPIFIDKPFAMTAKEARSIVNESLREQVSIQGGSTLCFDPQITLLTEASKHSSFGTITYRADINSPFGGYYFYGSHLTDLCAAIFGTNALAVRSFQHDVNLNHIISYPNRTVILHSTPAFLQPEVLLSSDNSIIKTVLDEKTCYFNGMKAFVETIEKGEIDSRKLDQLIFSINLLDAITRSLNSGEDVQLLN